jgi:hypothetical protein
MKHTNLLLFTFLFLFTGCFSLQTPSRAKSKEVDVQIITDSKSKEAGIHVRLYSPVYATGDNAGEVNISIVNLLEEEVFIEVTGLGKLGYSFRRFDKDGEIMAMAGGSGSFTVFPDNTRLLKRLHGASKDKNGKLGTCGCGFTTIKGKLKDKLDLKKWIGADTKISVSITGYLRKNGKQFSKYVTIPIKIINAQPEDSANSATASPADL